jgi:hypothetical protein
LAHVGLIIINVFTVKPSFKASSRSTWSEHQTLENLKWRNFNTHIIGVGSLKLNVKWRKLLNLGTLNGGSTCS